MSINSGLPSPAMLPYNRPIRGKLPQMNREPIYINNDHAKYEALKAHQNKNSKGNDAYKDSLSFPIVSSVAIQHDVGGPWIHGVIK